MSMHARTLSHVRTHIHAHLKLIENGVVKVCVCARTHTLIHVCVHTRIHIYPHTDTLFRVSLSRPVCVHTCTHLYMCVCTLAYTHTHTLTPYSECLCRGLRVWHTRTHLYMCVHTCIHTHPHTDTLSNVFVTAKYAHPQPCTPNHTDTHIHTHSLSLPLNLFIPDFVNNAAEYLAMPHTFSFPTIHHQGPVPLVLLYEHMHIHTGNNTRIAVSMCGTTTVNSQLQPLYPKPTP